MIDWKTKLLLVVVLAGICGCTEKNDERVKKPRPVEAATLKIGDPPASTQLSAVVASWKTEEIGMEVGGRIKFVVEPNTDVDVELLDESGQIKIKKTKIAELDKERFELQLASAQADIERAKQAIEAAEIEIDEIFPQRTNAAVAELERAAKELERSLQLVEQKAGAQSDVVRDQAAWENAKAQLKQIKAEKTAKSAELESLKKDQLKAEQAFKDAQRSVSDCELYADFAGQISEVHVVPGSVVTAGQPVATLQMMDPIKVELEVSAADSRRLRNRQRLPIWITGKQDPLDGFLYQVDSVADAQTRTFTINLLVFNERLSGAADVPEDCAKTPQTWPLNLKFLPETDRGVLYAPQKAIHQDENGNHYVWRVTNVKIHQSLPKDGRLLVEKMPIVIRPVEIPFLGNWTFQKIEINDSSFNTESDLIAGKLKYGEYLSEDKDSPPWEGAEVYLEKNSGQWMLRPGDLVQVDVSDSEVTKGFYVPMDAISYVDKKAFLFVIESAIETKMEDDKEIRVVKRTVKRQEIEIVNSDDANVSTEVEIKLPEKSVGSLNDMQYVTKGTHYLREGDAVRILSLDGSPFNEKKNKKKDADRPEAKE